MKRLIAVLIAVLFTAYAAVAAAQYVQWRLIGQSVNGNGTMTCVYEGRTSDGKTVTTTVVVTGFYCPSAPGATY